MDVRNLCALFELFVKHVTPRTCITLSGASTQLTPIAHCALLATIARPRTRRKLFLLDLHQLIDLDEDNSDTTHQLLEVQSELVEYFLDQIEMFWETSWNEELVTAFYINYPRRFPLKRQALRVERFIIRTCARYGQQHITSFGFFACRLAHGPVKCELPSYNWLCWCFYHGGRKQQGMCYQPLLHSTYYAGDGDVEYFDTVCLVDNMYTCIAQLLPSVVSLYVSAEVCSLLGDRCCKCRRDLLEPDQFSLICKQEKDVYDFPARQRRNDDDDCGRNTGILEKLRLIEFAYIRRWIVRERNQPAMHANSASVEHFLRKVLKHDNNQTRTCSPQVRIVYCRQNLFSIPGNASLQQQLLQQQQATLPLLQHPIYYGSTEEAYGIFNKLTDAFPNAAIVYRLSHFDLSQFIHNFFKIENSNNTVNNNPNTNEQQQRKHHHHLQPKIALEAIDNILGSLLDQAFRTINKQQASLEQVVVTSDSVFRCLSRPRSFLCFKLLSEICCSEQQAQSQFDPTSSSMLEALLSLKTFRALVAHVACNKRTQLCLTVGTDCQWRYVRELLDGWKIGNRSRGFELLFCQDICFEYWHVLEENWFDHGKQFCRNIPKNFRPKLRKAFGVYRGAWSNMRNTNNNKIDDGDDDNWLENFGMVANGDFRPLITMFDWTRRELDNKQMFALPTATKNLADAYCSEIVVARRCKGKALSYTH